VTVPPGGLGELRERELRRAGAILGVGQIAVLGFGDSGMSGDVTPPALAGCAAADVQAGVRGAVEAFGPDVLVTLDGSDGHRDHIAIREATVAVARELGIPVYLQCLRQDLMTRWALLVAHRNPDSEYLRLGELGTPAEDVTHVIDTAAYLEVREEAIAAHGSQVSPFEAMPEGLRREWLSSEHLVAVDPGDG
jgi:LmbE family N-acetylglucosaminyl deacetylase